jgi:hypothetical protein
LGSAQCSEKFDDGPINIALSKENKIKCEHTHELINTMALHFMVRSNKIMRNDAM